MVPHANWHHPTSEHTQYRTYQQQCAGPWFNIKMTSYQNRKSHCGDKTILQSSYLHNTGKMTSLYWIRALVASVVYGEWRWQQLVQFSFFLRGRMSASVIECRSIGSCSSSGLVCRTPDHRFPLSAATHTASLWHKMPVRGIRIIFKNLCYNTD